jgi:hypothetical protein
MGDSSSDMGAVSYTPPHTPNTSHGQLHTPGTLPSLTPALSPLLSFNIASPTFQLSTLTSPLQTSGPMPSRIATPWSPHAGIDTPSRRISSSSSQAVVSTRTIFAPGTPIQNPPQSSVVLSSVSLSAFTLSPSSHAVASLQVNDSTSAASTLASFETHGRISVKVSASPSPIKKQPHGNIAYLNKGIKNVYLMISFA